MSLPSRKRETARPFLSGLPVMIDPLALLGFLDSGDRTEGKHILLEAEVRPVGRGCLAQAPLVRAGVLPLDGEVRRHCGVGDQASAAASAGECGPEKDRPNQALYIHMLNLAKSRKR